METTQQSPLIEMAEAWNAMRAAAQRQFPQASAERIYQLTASAMFRALGLADDAAAAAALAAEAA